MWNNWMWARLSKLCVSLKRHLFRCVACRHPRWRRAGALPCLRRRRGSTRGERQEDGLGEGLWLRPLWGTCGPLRYMDLCSRAWGVLQNLNWGLPLAHFYLPFSDFLRLVCVCMKLYGSVVVYGESSWEDWFCGSRYKPKYFRFCMHWGERSDFTLKT